MMFDGKSLFIQGLSRCDGKGMKSMKLDSDTWMVLFIIVFLLALVFVFAHPFG